MNGVVTSDLFRLMCLTLILTTGFSVGDGYKWSEKRALDKSRKGDKLGSQPMHNAVLSGYVG